MGTNTCSYISSCSITVLPSTVLAGFMTDDEPPLLLELLVVLLVLLARELPSSGCVDDEEDDPFCCWRRYSFMKNSVRRVERSSDWKMEDDRLSTAMVELVFKPPDAEGDLDGVGELGADPAEKPSDGEAEPAEAPPAAILCCSTV